jgi:Arc/MetJ-type ribon-helix-helix transcriptional regulator
VPNLGVYIPDQLNARLQRLRDKGIDLNASNVARRALEVAVEAEEKALEGDRVPRLLARLASTKTARELAEAEGEAAGRAWAEEVAALSELRTVRALLEKMDSEQLEVYKVDTGSSRVLFQLMKWEADTDGPIVLDDQYTMPVSVPKEFFDRATLPDEKKVSHLSLVAGAFMRGAADVLGVAEVAIAKEAADKKLEAFRQAITKVSDGVTGRRKPQQKR